MKNGSADEHLLADEEESNGAHYKCFLSKRGSKALTPFSPYIQAVNEAKNYQWTPTNPEGYFLMATAESVLSFDLIHDKIRSCREVPATVGLYGDFRGGNRLRKAIAKMMERTFMGVEVSTANVCISSGVTAVLDLFFFATCDAGDGCLIPAPYFPAFDNDMAIRNGVEPIPVQPADTHTYIPTAVEMEEAALAAEKKGINPRVLLITNPGNPLGTLYPESTLKELLVWAVNRGLHVLCDEIYANSKFGPSANEFISMEKVASIAVNENLLSEKTVAQRVHTAYGMSKDFGMSGFRVGCIHTRNKGMQKFWQNMGMFAAVSNDTQHALSIMLEDEEFVDYYVAENNRRLKKSYEIFTSLLRAENVVYMPACAAMFCWLDLRSLLPEPTFEAEDRLWKELKDESRLILTPGRACHYAEPGFFRACYASMPPEHLTVATQRLTAFVERKRRKRKAEYPISV
ncbi:hypothetical protein R1flu_014228 [Riccia fluitans]|uniref:Aminotransferase class I/classII large domain-containing protein n=1 Tax=Riccia fluitans TaxID=41844 RepID=A0ABD1YJ83_9MARC